MPEITTAQLTEWPHGDKWAIFFDGTRYDIDPMDEQPSDEILAAFQEKRRERLAMLMARYRMVSGLDYQYEDVYEQLYSTKPIERWCAVTGDETYYTLYLSDELDSALDALASAHLNGEYLNVPEALWDLESGKQIGFMIKATAVLVDDAGHEIGAPDSAIPDRYRTSCGCGYELVWCNDHYEHDAAPFLWGDDHDPDAPEPDPNDSRVIYWKEQDGFEDA